MCVDKRSYKAQVDLRRSQETVTGRKLCQNLDTKMRETWVLCCGKTMRTYCIHMIYSYLAQQLLQRLKFFFKMTWYLYSLFNLLELSSV